MFPEIWRYEDTTKLSFTYEPTLCTAQRNTSSPANHPSPTDDFQEISRSNNTSSRPHTVITDVHREELHRGVNAFYPPTQFMPFVLVGVRRRQSEYTSLYERIILPVISLWSMHVHASSSVLNCAKLRWKTPLCPLRNWTERANVSVENLRQGLPRYFHSIQLTLILIVKFWALP